MRKRLLLSLLICITSASALTMTDGGAKKVLVHNHNSWKLGLSDSQLSSLSLGKIESTRDGIGSDLGVDESVNVVKGSWLESFNGNSGKDKPLILIVYANGLPVSGPDDKAGIDLGVRMLEKVSQVAKSKGADEVFFSGEHLTWFRFRDFMNKRKHRYYDHLVFDAYNKKTGKQLSTDIQQESIKDFQFCVKSDMEHPAEYGKELYRNHWLRMFYQYDGKPIPTQVDNELNKIRTRELDALKKSTMEQVKPANAKSIKVGDDVTLNMNPEKDNLAYIRVIGYVDGYAGLFIVKDSVMCKGGQTTTYSFKMPDVAPVSHYTINQLPLPKVSGDSIQIQVFFGREPWSGMGNTWRMGPVMKYYNQDGSQRINPSTVTILREASVRNSWREGISQPFLNSYNLLGKHQIIKSIDQSLNVSSAGSDNMLLLISK